MRVSRHSVDDRERSTLLRRALRWMCTAALALTSATACSRWRAGPLPAPASGPVRVLDVVRLTLKTGATIELENVVVTSDSIVGLHYDPEAHPARSIAERAAVARRDVVATYTREPSRRKSVVLVVVLAFALAVAQLAIVVPAVGD